MKIPLGSGEKTPKTIDVIPEDTPPQPTPINQKDKQSFTDDLIEDDEQTLLEELEDLGKQEANLKQERNTLLTFRDQLRQKIRDELALRRRNVEQLKTEVAFMKAECEGLVKVVNSSVNASSTK